MRVNATVAQRKSVPEHNYQSKSSENQGKIGKSDLEQRKTLLHTLLHRLRLGGENTKKCEYKFVLFLN